MASAVRPPTPTGRALLRPHRLHRPRRRIFGFCGGRSGDRFSVPENRSVIVGSLRRSMAVVSRWIAVGGLCAVLVLSACGRQSNAGTSGASAATGTSTVIAAAFTTIGASSSNPSTTGTGKVGPSGWGTAGQPTDPRITPRRGGPRTVFTVKVTSRTRLGSQGAFTAMYRIEGTGPPRTGCDRALGVTVHHGGPGQRLTVLLRPGPAGWCQGDWRGTVLLETGPNCGQGSGAARTQPCPQFASRLIEAGRFEWHVR